MVCAIWNLVELVKRLDSGTYPIDKAFMVAPAEKGLNSAGNN